MTTRSKYATLDAVIADEVRRWNDRGMWSPHGNERIRAFAFAAGGYHLISRRLQHLRARGAVTNNGKSGDGCRWFAAPERVR